MLEFDNNIYSIILDTFIKIKEDVYLKNISTYGQVINDFIPIRNDEKEQIKNQSIYFNVFDFFNINEPLHSKLIASLLDPYGNHGQGNIFLKTFLDIIEIEFQETDVWQVTAEIGRIDILLKCLNRNSVVIIENKSNGAIDQPNQLYRYWYQEIYLPYEFSGKVEKPLSNAENFRIIYLAPNKGKIYDQQSIEKPVELSHNLSLPLNLKNEEIHHYTFSEIIVPWLNKCNELDSLSKENHRIREFINQYKKLWGVFY